MSCEVCLYGAYPNCPCCGPEVEDDGDESTTCEGAGAASGCEGCDDCLYYTVHTKVVVARAPRSAAGAARRARLGINPGDRIRVTTGFDYQVNGPRTGYFRNEVPVR
jgi:hypothetical protein